MKTILKDCRRYGVDKISALFGESGLDGYGRLAGIVRELYPLYRDNMDGKRLVIFEQLIAFPAGLSIPVDRPAAAGDPGDFLGVFWKYVLLVDGAGLVKGFELEDWEVRELSKYGLVYINDGRGEIILASEQEIAIVPLINDGGSAIAPDRFADLPTAFQHYYNRIVKNYTMGELEDIWCNNKKLYLVNKPEHKMRDSLARFLASHIREEVEVLREQNVDESHPVDIRISWLKSAHRALIEVKWLGVSLNADGKPSTTYRDQRARDGAKQLAEYLDSQKQSSPLSINRGYLVIYDCRRAGLNDDVFDGAVDLTEEQLSNYEKRDIDFGKDYQYEKIRDDFHVPSRWFLGT